MLMMLVAVEDLPHWKRERCSIFELQNLTTVSSSVAVSFHKCSNKGICMKIPCLEGSRLQYKCTLPTKVPPSISKASSFSL
jgi:hypothetical protein